ncbi:hypothetical protein J6I39_05735 [bacterium]|nr:hypothetical protein [bacterium]
MTEESPNVTNLGAYIGQSFTLVKNDKMLGWKPQLTKLNIAGISPTYGFTIFLYSTNWFKQFVNFNI